MISAQDLLNAHLLLGQLHLEEPALAIQNVAMWLFPSERFEGLIHPDNIDPWVFFDEGDDEVVFALLCCRRTFPEIYEAALARIQEGIQYDRLYHFLEQSINGELVDGEIWELSHMTAGVPIVGMGADFYDDEWWDHYDDITLLLNEVDIHQGLFMGANHHEIVTEKDRAAMTLVTSLVKERPPALPIDDDEEDIPPRLALAWLLLWLFSETGIGQADYSFAACEEMMGYSGERLEWTPDNVEYINQEHREAHRILAAVRAANRLLEKQPEWREALIRNWKHVENIQKHGRTATRRSCRWPDDPPRGRRAQAQDRS